MGASPAHELPAVCRRGKRRPADGQADAAVPVQVHHGHHHCLDDWHPQPGHDCRVERGRLAGGPDVGTAHVGGTLQGDHRLPIRHPPLGFRLAPGALYVGRHADSVFRFGHHAVCTACFVRPGPGAGARLVWSGGRCAGLSDGRRRTANLANSGPGTCHRPGQRRDQATGGRLDVCHALARRGRR